MAEPSATPIKLYSLEEVAQNKDKKWIAIHNSVYDVNPFLNEHPGGEEILIEQAGKDATEPFEDVGHSTDARELMAKYKIGELIEADRRDTKVKKHDWKSSEEGGSPWSSWLVPAAIGIVATIIYRCYLLYQSSH
ncbi:cytochrome b5 isoform X2 [Ischnura elegans]|uniref:cytochrome b5 isoform X2 n=1 Tax=Ischnura elegans TaxID=197161 RepID=UPI001ED88697|nr:cytochrome b5 isoform X2 [Ischnura elegans]